ncbi:hypothetical protein HK098_000776 [Nowakowskiella sp. JEL0407]|nr:hypothetical protein HK098_000776 [Nowakowskiella sp. JEL0407]
MIFILNLFLAWCFLHRITAVPLPESTTPTINIAIIGAGSAGTSTAYYLSKLTANFNVTIYEETNRIGGRAFSKLVPIGNSYITVEYGASLIASVNYNLANATNDLGLVSVPSKWTEIGGDTVSGFGVWNGSWRYKDIQALTWTTLTNSLTNVLLLLQYGLLNGPTKAQNLVNPLIDKFLLLYNRLSQVNPFTSVADIITSITLSDVVQSTASSYFRSNNINEAFMTDIIGGITKNCYGQEMDTIEAIGAIISLYSSLGGIFKIKGGNEKLFQKMAIASGATIRLNSIVTSVNGISDGRFAVSTATDTSAYDVVVMAAPIVPDTTPSIQFGNLDLSSVIPMEYVQIHGELMYTEFKFSTNPYGLVTIVVGEVKPLYWKILLSTDFPGDVLIPSGLDPLILPFHSVGLLYTKTELLGRTTQVVKFFSKSVLNGPTLANCFRRIDYTDREVWNSPGAYPNLLPKQLSTYTGSFEVSPGFYYANIMEGFISTMETQSVSGRNIANAIWQKYIK